MGAKHTPGPWALRIALGYAWVAHEGRTVASIPADDTREDGEGIIEEILSSRAKADARLIAAAPDLLDVVLRSLMYLLPGSSLEAEAKALIAKARGQ